MLQYCIHPGCSQIVSRGRCARHAVQEEHARDNYAIRRWYRTARWTRLRTRVLREQTYACAQCGQVQLALDVDHIQPHRGDARLFWDRTNLQALCSPCHTRKTDTETRQHPTLRKC